MRISWVVGGSGLLGSALRAVLLSRGDKVFTPTEPFCWNDPEKLTRQLAHTLERFATDAESYERWEIYWAAGVGTMGASSEALTRETQALGTLLELIRSQSILLENCRTGGIVYSSSAGAIYAGCKDEVISEASEVAPTTAYAQAKLSQENMLIDFVATRPSICLLIARISTLYGPGQSSGKGQGLLTHIARSLVRNQPVQIYVPFDTIRDYVASSDAANSIVCALNDLEASSQRCLVRIIASEQAVTISEIVATFRRLSRRHLRVITCASRLSALYARKIRFQSQLPKPTLMSPPKSLTVGLAELLHFERQQFAVTKIVEVTSGGCGK